MFSFNAKTYIDFLANDTGKSYIKVYREFLTHFFLLLSACLFFSYSIIFYYVGLYYLSIIKLTFGIMALLLILFTKINKNIELSAKIFCLILVVYTTVVIFDTTERSLGFIWTFFVPLSFVSLMGHQKGLFYCVAYIVYMFIIGIIDVLYTNYQFETFVNFSLYFCAIVSISVIYWLMDFALVHLQKMLTIASNTDSLTNLYNRRKIDETLKNELDKNKNYIFSVAILDIDDFKRVNDLKGHLFGDKVLKKFANIIKDSVRKSDTVGRWGGEEFIIILPFSNLENANKRMKIIQEKIRNTVFEGWEYGITCSFGLMATNGDLSLSELILKVDHALYEAKTSGKNKIVLPT